jgi:hypothetical protein
MRSSKKRNADNYSSRLCVNVEAKNFTACGGVRYPTFLRKISIRYVASPNGREPISNACAADVPNVLVPKCSGDAAGAIDNILQSRLHHGSV